MLLEFSVNNFKSIKDTIKFSMLASSKDSDNFFEIRKYKLLKSAVLYGANASGKSNVLDAMGFMKRVFLNKDKIIQSTDKIPHEPFKLNSETEASASYFEIVFFIDEVKYRYGFELDSETVYSEWLYADTNGKEAKLFYRDLEEDSYVNPTKFSEGMKFLNKKSKKIEVSNNQLLIWKCDQENGEISKILFNWFFQFNTIDGINPHSLFTFEKMEDADFKSEIKNLIKTADIGIDDIEIEETLDKDIPNGLIDILPKDIQDEISKEGGLKTVSLNTQHKKFDKNDAEIGNVVFELSKEESAGTQKFFAISAPILDTLKNGRILIIDELDANLHPVLTQHLIKLFHDKNINKNNAQLIFATHDTNLLSAKIFQRGQIWLTEKNKYGATDLYSLAQFKTIRKDTDFEKPYLIGKYGAIPYIGNFEL